MDNFSLCSENRQNTSDCLKYCPSECEADFYSADMSYGALSSLSVQQLLYYNKENLEKNFHFARNIKHRVETEHLKETIQRFQSIAHKLEVSAN